MAARVSARLRGLCGRNRDRTSGAASSVGIQWDLQRECAALSGLGFDGEISIMHARDLARKPQAEACARGMGGRRGLDATEAREQAALGVLVETRDVAALLPQGEASLLQT